MELMRTGCVTVFLEDTPLTRANRLVLRLLAAAYAAEDLFTEAMGLDAGRLGEVAMLREAIAEAERTLAEKN